MKDIRNPGFGTRKKGTGRKAQVTSGTRGYVSCSILFLLYLTAAMRVYAQPPVGEEYRVKAGFIFNFAKFVEWSEEAFQDEKSPILLCVFPPDIFNNILFTQHIGDREILIKPYQNDEDVKCCHILFLGVSDKNFVQEKLNAVKDKKNILTVGESENFNQMGGIISFVTERERVNLVTEKRRLTFDINLNAAKQAGLKLSSQLLRTARKIEGNP